MPALRRTKAAVVALGAAIAGACSRGEQARPSAETTAVTHRPAAGTLVRVAYVADSSGAAALADSLDREGWDVAPGSRCGAGAAWRVRAAGMQPRVVGAQTSTSGIAVSVVAVNRGTHGMSARVRWVSSPDRRGLLVVEDPRGAENDPVPNGFVFAREGSPPVQRDSTWDAAAAPDWKRGVGLRESIVRLHAFPTSGMVSAFGAARTFVVDVTVANDTTPVREVALPIAEGWRLAWAANGSRLAIGAPADVISDDGQASRWRLVDPESGASRGVVDATSLAPVQWVEGPTIDASTTVDMTQRRAFRGGGVDIESEDGWIRLFVSDGGRVRVPRIIGPGIALASTASGEFVVAIAPDPNAKSYDPPNHLIVYHTIRQ